MERNSLFANYTSNIGKPAKPVLIRVGMDNGEYVGDYNIDTIDAELFEYRFRQKLKLNVSENVMREPCMKVVQSQLLHTCADKYDVMSGKVFKSKPCFEDRDAFLKLPFKSNLRNIRKFNKQQTKFSDVIMDDMNCHRSPYKKLSIERYESNENEKSLIALQLKKKSTRDSGGFMPSITAFTKEIEFIKNEPKYTNSKLDITIKSLNNDSRFLPVLELDRSAIGSSRPAFVERLFKKYDYEELELPGRKVQNRTKEKAFNLALIKDLYNKLTNWIVG
jgi:hypothetical protein